MGRQAQPQPLPRMVPSSTNIQVQVQDSVNHAIIPGATVYIPEGITQYEHNRYNGKDRDYYRSGNFIRVSCDDHQLGI